MATAPVVANISDLIGQYTSAQAPQQAELDDENQANDQSGNAQTAGLNAAKTGAFGDITQQANNRGMFFSGFTPDAEAKYTSSTYLPALAKVQAAIAGVRDTIMGKKADLTTAANTSAINEQSAEQKSLDSYNAQQAEDEATLARQQSEDAARLNEAEVTSGPTAAETKASQATADFNAANSYLKGQAGKDTFVSPEAFNAARQSWVDAGYSAASFNSNFKNFVNPKQAAIYPTVKVNGKTVINSNPYGI